MKFFRLRKTNTYFIEGPTGRYLAFDVGWPCTLFEYRRMLKGLGLAFDDLELVLVSHLHLDHAGLVGALAQEGKVCLLTVEQAAAVGPMEAVIRRNPDYANYQGIPRDSVTILPLAEVQGLVATRGYDVELLATPGHTPDGVTLLTGGFALIGDLSPPLQCREDDEESLRSWSLIRSRGARVAYPSHADPFEL